MTVKDLAPAGAVKEFVISRVFDAPRDFVWKAFTECEHLVHWWGPAGFKMASCKMDFRPGGTFHYCLEAPDGQKMWGKFLYKEIKAPERFVHIVHFSDEKGGITRHPMAPSWPLQTIATAEFAAEGDKTRLTVHWAPHEATAEEAKTFDQGRDGMRQGWTGTMDQLDGYLAKRKRG